MSLNSSNFIIKIVQNFSNGIKMDKTELENGLKKLNYILNTKGADQIINDLKKNKN